MRVWRGLKETGCGVLRDGVYLLPASAIDGTVLARMESEIRSNGGFAMTLELKAASTGQFAEIRKLFDRSAEYGVLVQRIADAKGSLARLGPRRAQTAIRRVERGAEKLSRIDFFASGAKSQGAAAMAALQANYHAMDFRRGAPAPERGPRP